MYNILVVDDEKDIVAALEIYLRSEGYRVLSASNGREALSIAAREDVHLILMDIMMPVMDGLTAMAQLRQTSNVPVILLTAKGEDTDKVLGLNVARMTISPSPSTRWSCWRGCAPSCGGIYSWGADRCRPARWSSAVSAWTTTPRPSPWTATRWR